MVFLRNIVEIHLNQQAGFPILDIIKYLTDICQLNKVGSSSKQGKDQLRSAFKRRSRHF